MTPIQLAAFKFVAGRLNPSDPKPRDVDLRYISEPLRQRLIDLAMMEPPLVDVDGPRVFLTRDGEIKRRELLPATPDASTKEDGN